VCLWAPIGVPDARWCPKERPLGYVNRKPGPAPWGLPPSGPASVPTRGRARLGLSPTGRRPPRKGRDIGSHTGREAPKEWRRPKGSTGEGTPRRDPGGPAGRSRPQGRAWSGLQDQPRRPRPICGGAVRPDGTSHGAARPTGSATAPPRPKLGATQPAVAERRKRAVDCGVWMRVGA
jgi:hypothetical protein